MTSERAAITAALNQADIDNVLYNKDEIPKSLPAAIVTLESEVGKNSTSRRFTDTDLGWSVFLIVNAQNAIDPDADLYTLKESFRDKYLCTMGRDFPAIEYYSGRIDGARLVRIAKISLLRSGIGAGS
jgi:hypothetical protein